MMIPVCVARVECCTNTVQLITANERTNEQGRPADSTYTTYHGIIIIVAKLGPSISYIHYINKQGPARQAAKKTLSELV